MAFSGIRDLSLINTPPKNRMPIETNVIEFEQGTIRSAIIREIKRDGQVFFVVPRIKDIRSIEEFLKSFLPEVKYMVATGKTRNVELEKTISKIKITIEKTIAQLIKSWKNEKLTIAKKNVEKLKSWKS